MKNPVIVLPKTVSELKRTNSMLYEEFLRQNLKFGVTYKEFCKEIRSK